VKEKARMSRPMASVAAVSGDFTQAQNLKRIAAREKPHYVIHSNGIDNPPAAYGTAIA